MNDPIASLDPDLREALAVELDDGPASHGPADLGSVLDALEVFIRRFVSFGNAHQVVAVVLWVAHTWAFDAAETTPRLAITSPERRSGKSRLLEVLERLVRTPLLTTNISVAALFRLVDDSRPTILFDEVDAIFSPRSKQEGAEDLRGLLNAGHRRQGGEVVRMVGQGAAMHPQRFKVFAPVALAGIGRLPDTVADRAIPIRLERRAADEFVEPFRFRTVEAEAVALRELLEAWAEQATPSLAEARPAIPAGLNDRAADSWEPLFAIADAAGPEWARRAREAAIALHREEEVRSASEELLAAIRRVFEERQVDRMSSRELVDALNEEEDAPWGGELTPRALAARLRRYRRPDGSRLAPATVRLADGRTPKGYLLEWFTEAFRRHIPQVSATSATSATPQVAPTSGVADVSDVADVGGSEDGSGAGTGEEVLI